MKKRVAFALASALVCIGLTVWLVPFAPFPRAEDFQEVRILRISGAESEEITDRVDQTALYEALTQCRASRIPMPQHSYSMDGQRYELLAIYHEAPQFLEIGEINWVYDGSGWVHNLKNGEELLAKLNEICAKT